MSTSNGKLKASEARELTDTLLVVDLSEVLESIKEAAEGGYNMITIDYLTQEVINELNALEYNIIFKDNFNPEHSYWVITW